MGAWRNHHHLVLEASDTDVKPWILVRRGIMRRAAAPN
jgi:hypothetical protein